MTVPFASRLCRTSTRNPVVLLGIVPLLVLLGTLCTLQGTVLDNFNGAKTGWTDSLNSGTVAQGSGVLVISTATNSGSVTYSTKTASAFTNIVGHTLEFRVDANTMSPGQGNTNVLAILSWVPSGGAVLGSGYSVVVGAGTVQIQKGSTILYSTNYVAAGTNIQNTNITLVLRMSAAVSGVTLNARVYRQTFNEVGKNFTVLFERTVVDGAGIIGTGGNAALGVLNLDSPTGASVTYDNLQVFDLQESVLDDFRVPDNLSGWTVFMKHPGAPDAVTETSGQVECVAGVDSLGGFAGAYYSGKTFKIVDGGRVEFSVDFDNLNGPGSYSVLGYLPGGGLPAAFSLSEYHIAHNINNTSYLVIGKNYNGWWTTGPNGLPVQNCRYTLTMSGEGTNCRIEGRLEDLSQDVNSPTRVAFQNVFVDTPAVDFPGDGATLTPLPYLNADGNFLISAFNAGTPINADVIFRNARVTQTVPQNSAPIISSLFPPDGSNFVASASAVTFRCLDDVNTPVDNIVVTLNGVVYTNGSPGVTISGNNQNRLFTLTNALAANVNYVGSVKATDNQGASILIPLRFDTFLTNDFVLEAEEYNFSSDNGLTGGSFIDNPLLLAETSTDPNAYNSQPGLPQVDFHDNRGTSYQGNGGNYDAEHTFRTYDLVRTSHSPDFPRAKYVNAGGANAFFFETDVVDIYDGDWLNYTHTYPGGTYNVYLRQSQYRLPFSFVTLEKVSGDRTTTNQTTTVTGGFVGEPGGTGLYYNWALEDGVGKPVALRLSGGVETLRLVNRITGNSDDAIGIITQNYMVFVPIADPGTLRPVVALAQPLHDTTVNTVAPVVTASIVNRDTSITANTVALYVNGNLVQAAVTPTATGADLSYALATLPPPDKLVTNTIVFQDSQGVNLTNTWTWQLTYSFLRASNSLPVGSLKVRGFDVRMVQKVNGGANLDNSLSRAEQQLAIPPEIPFDNTATSIVQVLDWNENGSPNNVPGLCAGAWDNIATEIFAYLELTPGVHRFHLNSDDRAGLYSGAKLKNPAPVVLFEAPNNTANTTFDFVVEAAGLYPFRIVWEETGGGSALSLRSVDLNTSAETLLNDPANPAGVVKAWYPIACVSSDSIAGTFAVDPAATHSVTLADVLCGNTGEVINQMVTGGTFTVPISGAARFYRIDGPRGTKISNVSRTGSNLTIQYQVQ